jgi:hypothetical protein
MSPILAKKKKGSIQNQNRAKSKEDQKDSPFGFQLIDALLVDGEIVQTHGVLAQRRHVIWRARQQISKPETCQQTNLFPLFFSQNFCLTEKSDSVFHLLGTGQNKTIRSQTNNTKF